MPGSKDLSQQQDGTVAAADGRCPRLHVRAVLDLGHRGRHRADHSGHLHAADDLTNPNDSNRARRVIQCRDGFPASHGERGRRHAGENDLLARAAIPARLFAHVCPKITPQAPPPGAAPQRGARLQRRGRRTTAAIFALLARKGGASVAPGRFLAGMT